MVHEPLTRDANSHKTPLRDLDMASRRFERCPYAVCLVLGAAERLGAPSFFLFLISRKLIGTVPEFVLVVPSDLVSRHHAQSGQQPIVIMGTTFQAHESMHI